MDPVSALGLAAAVVQFVAFGSKILTSASEIWNSSADASAETLSLESVYSKLGALSANLGDASRRAVQALARDAAHTNSSLDQPQCSFRDSSWGQLESEGEGLAIHGLCPTLRDSYSSLGSLLSSCQTDCSRIFDIVARLKAANKGSRWSCFRVALKTMWHQDEIAQIEKRLQRFQQQVILEMCTISNIYHDIRSKELATFRQESRLLGMQQAGQLAAIDSLLKQLLDRGESRKCPNSASTALSDLERMMSQLDMSERRLAKELAVVRSLGFESRTVRHDAIPDAHRNTFQWVFRTHRDPSAEEPTGSERPRESESYLLEWLKQGGGTFWVSGKPGSGKSTFMKFLADHPRTLEALSEWSRPLPVIIASHYFWSSGTDMQTSQKGLLQTLLYEIFRHCPDLLELVCQSRWAAKENARQSPWTLAELQLALRTVSKQTQIASKFCFFIDGLDEFQGEHLDFCQDLVTMLNSSNIKQCLSSRRWNVFKDAFGNDSQKRLYIHELTRPDILQYAQDRLEEHPRWNMLRARPGLAAALVQSIADKADGVFLWVFIVTRLLREGLTNEDSFSDLRRRLESFPADLEPFYKQMLESVPSFYRPKMAAALLIALAAKEPLDAMIYSVHDNEDDVDDTDFQLQFDFDAFGWHAPLTEVNEHIIPRRRKQVSRRLNGWCRCLLEPDSSRHINFLHRTVADFLKTTGMLSFLRAEASKGLNTPQEFKPNLAILRAHIGWLHIAGIKEGDFSINTRFLGTSHLMSHLAIGLRKALDYAASAELETIEDKLELDDTIDELDQVVSTLMTSIEPQHVHERWTFGLDKLDHMFREVVLEKPLLGYLSRKLPNSHSYFSPFNSPAIYAVLNYPEPRYNSWPLDSERKLKCVLHCGHSLNEYVYLRRNRGVPSNFTALGTMGVEDLGGVKKITHWEWLVTETMPVAEFGLVEMGPRYLATITARLFQVCLEHGADPNANFGSNWSVFDRFIALSLDVPSDKGLQNAYLAALDSFFNHGAKPGGQRQFFNLLLDAMSIPASLGFLAVVARRILPFAHENWRLSANKNVLTRLLQSSPDDSAEEREDENAHVDEVSPNGKRKRAGEHTLERPKPWRRLE